MILQLTLLRSGVNKNLRHKNSGKNLYFKDKGLGPGEGVGICP